jgi:membrane dipeptidase
MRIPKSDIIILATSFVLFGCSQPPAATTTAVAAQLTAAEIHEKLIVLDSHLDTPMLLELPSFDITHRHDVNYDFSQVDLPRMIEGNLDGGFWVIYTPQGPLTLEGYQKSRNQAMMRAFAIHKMTNQFNQHFALATTSEQAISIVNEGKRVVLVSMENAYPLGTDLSLLPLFYDMGLRMLGPVHFKNNQFGDSSTDPDGQQWGGLSSLGKELVIEANRLGILLDGSHAHDDLVKEMILLSKTPIILSHTGTKSIYDHPRNIDDELLRALVTSGGVIQMNAYSSYLAKLDETPERSKVFAALMKETGSISELDQDGMAMFLEKRRDIDKQFPASKASFEDYMEHFLYVLNIAGSEHVGVGADWDGGGGVHGMMDVSMLPKITERLLSEGYSEENLANIWGGNMLRVLEEARVYAELQGRDQAIK